MGRLHKAKDRFSAVPSTINTCTKQQCNKHKTITTNIKYNNNTNYKNKSMHDSYNNNNNRKHDTTTTIT